MPFPCTFPTPLDLPSSRFDHTQSYCSTPSTSRCCSVLNPDTGLLIAHLAFMSQSPFLWKSHWALDLLLMLAHTLTGSLTLPLCKYASFTEVWQDHTVTLVLVTNSTESKHLVISSTLGTRLSLPSVFFVIIPNEQFQNIYIRNS